MIWGMSFGLIEGGIVGAMSGERRSGRAGRSWWGREVGGAEEFAGRRLFETRNTKILNTKRGTLNAEHETRDTGHGTLIDPT